MDHTDELWRIYGDNGEPVEGKGVSKEEFYANDELIMSNAHVWLWRSDGENIDILLQNCSMSKPRRPGWYHISAAGR